MNTARSTFKSLHVRNFRLFFFGQMVSQCGTWMQTIALGWLVLDLSHNSGFAVGLVICYQILSGDVSDHLPEYATLKAMGHGNLYLARVVVQESLILAVAG